MPSAVSYLNVGLYPIPEAGALLSIPATKLRRWIREYEYTAKGRQYCHHSLIKRQFGEEKQILSFLELMELHFIKMFRSEGVSMATIRRAAEAAAEMYDTDYPFAVQRFDTDGRRIFVTLQREVTGRQKRSIVEDLGRGQQVFEQIMRPFFRKLEYRDAKEVWRFWPLERAGGIVLDPARKFGRPIDAGTGVPTRALYEAFRADQNQDERAVAKWFHVPLRAVRAAIRFEKSLLS